MRFLIWNVKKTLSFFSILFYLKSCSDLVYIPHNIRKILAVILLLFCVSGWLVAELWPRRRLLLGDICLFGCSAAQEAPHWPALAQVPAAWPVRAPGGRRRWQLPAAALLSSPQPPPVERRCITHTHKAPQFGGICATGACVALGGRLCWGGGSYVKAPYGWRKR